VTRHNENSSMELPRARERLGSASASGHPEARKADVFFLFETHLHKAKADGLRRKLFYDHYIIVEGECLSGSLL
jgi:hypothetical protein